MKILLPDHSPFLRNSIGLKEFCSDFFQALQLEYFDYGHYYDNGDCLTLSTHPIFIQKHYEQELYMTVQEFDYVRHMHGEYQNMFTFYTPELSVTNNIPTKNKHLANMVLGSNGGISNFRFYLFNRREGYYELTGFSSSDSSNSELFYIKNFTKLVQFVGYFKERCVGMINELKQGMVNVPPPNELKVHNKARVLLYYDQSLGMNISVKLSHQEVQCLETLSHGRSFKDAAKILNLSPRTVESYITRIKHKTGVHSKSRLASLIL